MKIDLTYILKDPDRQPSVPHTVSKGSSASIFRLWWRIMMARPGLSLLIENSPLGDLNAKLKWLLDAKADKPGAANNRRKYISSMLGWAIQQLPPLVSRKWLAM